MLKAIVWVLTEVNQKFKPSLGKLLVLVALVAIRWPYYCTCGLLNSAHDRRIISVWRCTGY